MKKLILSILLFSSMALAQNAETYILSGDMAQTDKKGWQIQLATS